MRIRELFENRFFNDNDYVKKTESGREIDYDLPDDLIYFMHNDDNAYRRHVYPVIVKCLDSIEHKKEIGSNAFAPAIRECYKLYTRQYPIRELPHELSEETCKEVADKFYEELQTHIQEGKYKD